MLKTEPSSAWKAVYLAPYSSVVQETLRQWSSKLGSGLGLKIAELTGDLHADLKVWFFHWAALQANQQYLPAERFRKTQ